MWDKNWRTLYQFTDAQFCVEGFKFDSQDRYSKSGGGGILVHINDYSSYPLIED